MIHVTERLLLDVMLGKLATYLRMCGHDAAYALDRESADDGGKGAGAGEDRSGREAGNDGESEVTGIENDDALLALAREEDRRLVTRNADLAARADDTLLVSATDVDEQLRELGAAGVDLS